METGSSNVQIFFSIYFRMRSSFASHFRILPLESIVVLESKLVANKTSWDRTCQKVHVSWKVVKESKRSIFSSVLRQVKNGYVFRPRRTNRIFPFRALSRGCTLIGFKGLKVTSSFPIPMLKLLRPADEHQTEELLVSINLSHDCAFSFVRLKSFAS